MECLGGPLATYHKEYLLSYTAARVTANGLPYKIVGSDKETITDFTVTTNSEAITANDLGLNAIYSAQADVNTGQATDTGTYAKATIGTGLATATLAEFTAAGAAATTAASTVIRVVARGY